MNRKEFLDYQKSVNNFFEKEGISNLSTASDEHPVCLGCQEHTSQESFFSNSSCDCCGSYLAGDRYHASGYNPKTEEVYCYDVCQDCYYYAEYGTLDDQSMLDIVEPDTKPYKFDRFDICEGYYCYAMDCHGGQFTETYKIFGRLENLKFRPRPTLEAETLEENAQAIYNRLVMNGYRGEKLTDEEKENTYLY